MHPLLPAVLESSNVVVLESLDGVDEKLQGLHTALRNSIGEYDLSNVLSEDVVSRIETFVSGLDESERFFKLNWRRLNPGLVLLALKSTLEEAEEMLMKNLESSGEVSGLTQAYVDVFDTGLDIRLVQEAARNGKILDSLDGDQRYILAFSRNLNVADLESFASVNIPMIPAGDFASINRLNDLPEDWRSAFSNDAPVESLVEDERVDKFYLNDDVSSLIKELEGFEEMEGVMLKSVLHGRNESWANKIVKIFKEGDALIAIGIAHLHQSYQGGRTVLDILKDRGFDVRALPKSDYLNGPSSKSCRSLLKNSY